MMLKKASLFSCQPIHSEAEAIQFTDVPHLEKTLPKKTHYSYTTGSTSTCQAASPQPVSEDSMSHCA